MIYVGNNYHALEGNPNIQIQVLRGFIISAVDTTNNEFWRAKIPLRRKRNA